MWLPNQEPLGLFCSGMFSPFSVYDFRTPLSYMKVRVYGTSLKKTSLGPIINPIKFHHTLTKNLDFPHHVALVDLIFHNTLPELYVQYISF